MSSCNGGGADESQWSIVCWKLHLYQGISFAHLQSSAIRCTKHIILNVHSEWQNTNVFLTDNWHASLSELNGATWVKVNSTVLPLIVILMWFMQVLFLSPAKTTCMFSHNAINFAQAKVLNVCFLGCMWWSAYYWTILLSCCKTKMNKFLQLLFFMNSLHYSLCPW